MCRVCCVRTGYIGSYSESLSSAVLSAGGCVCLKTVLQVEPEDHLKVSVCVCYNLRVVLTVHLLLFAVMCCVLGCCGMGTGSAGQT